MAQDITCDTTTYHIDLSNASLAEESALGSAMVDLVGSMRKLHSQGVDIQKIKYCTLEPEALIGLLDAIQAERKWRNCDPIFPKEACLLVMNTFLNICHEQEVYASSNRYEEWAKKHPALPSYVTMRKVLGPAWSDVLKQSNEFRSSPLR